MKFEVWACDKPTPYKGIYTLIRTHLIIESDKDDKDYDYEILDDLTSFLLGDE